MTKLQVDSAGQRSAGAEPDSGAQIHRHHLENGVVQAICMRMPCDLGDESIIEMEGLEGALQLRALAVCSTRLQLVVDAAGPSCARQPRLTIEDQLRKDHHMRRGQFVVVLALRFVRGQWAVKCAVG